MAQWSQTVRALAWRAAFAHAGKVLPGPGSDMRQVEISVRNRYIAYDAKLLPGLAPEVFEPQYLRAEGLLRGTENSPRGSAWVFELDGSYFLLRHYRHGGAMSRLIRDHYLWTSRSRTRPAREWRMLSEMRAHGLPVPAPAAWRVERLGPLLYRADLITALIRRCRTLHRLLLEQELPVEGWRRLGATLRRFHDRRVWHPDLTAGNILVDQEGRFHVIDFDRARLRRGQRWKVRNLRRLRRSFVRQRERDPTLHYRDAHFRVLLEAYRRGGSWCVP